MWKTAGKCLGGRAEVWILVQENVFYQMSNKTLDGRALGARDWEEISIQMVIKALGMDKITQEESVDRKEKPKD